MHYKIKDIYISRNIQKCKMNLSYLISVDVKAFRSLTSFQF